MATPPTPEELLRLARKAWPDQSPHLEICDDGVVYIHGFDDRGRLVEALLVLEGRGRPLEATHAALLVLAGELDVAALVAERDSALELLDSLIADDLHHIGWRAAWRRFRQLWTGTRWTSAEQAAGHTGENP